jgi:hypothetical protein
MKAVKLEILELLLWSQIAGFATMLVIILMSLLTIRPKPNNQQSITVIHKYSIVIVLNSNKCNECVQ